MANQLLDTFFGTVKDAFVNTDLKKIEEYTGQKVDTVDQFMARTEHRGRKNYRNALVAGIVGGIVAAGVKMIVDSQTLGAGEESIEDEYAEAVVDAAEDAAGVELTEQQDDIAEALVEFGMGAVIGGVYGLVTEALPDATQFDSEKMMTTAKQLAVPALGLAPAAVADVATDKSSQLAGHTAFVGTLEAVRRLTRYYLEQ